MFTNFRIMSRIFLIMTILSIFATSVILLCHSYIGIDLHGHFLITLCFLILLFSVPGIFGGLTVLTKALEKALVDQDIQLTMQKQQLPGKKK